MTETLTQAISLINDRLLGYILMAALVSAGIYFTIATRFVQFVRPKEMFRLMTGGNKKKGHISSFQAFSISTASRVGTGNIAGVAIAITTGGPGAVFWMWLIAVIGSASAFVESTLAQVYKVKAGAHFRGGPAYYMQTALNARKLALSFSVIITLTFAFVFNSVQANTIAASLQSTFGCAPLWTGIAVSVLTAVIIFGGLRRVAKFSSVIVPAFALAYIVITIAVILLNLEKLPDVFRLIFSDAFSLRNAAGGALGATIMTGARRGLFSNEAGMGSAPNAAATANISHPVKQGYVQAFSVFVDTLLICSCTAFIVLLTDYQHLAGEGIALTQHALTQELGGVGNYFLSASVLLFAFTSIIGNYYYGQANVEFLTRSRTTMVLFRAGVSVMVFLGAVLQLKLVWNAADLFMTVMALMNLYAIFRLRRQALDVLADYRRQKAQGKDPVFNPANVPSVQHTEAWHIYQ
ncbi:MAG: alanine/glycine:cation symporter family protein [Candidatus Avelusimicrobium sp.]|uniref:alanine/glycine:cation symporter family protein n=1 Tax=Candidatus Avelusimicrobium sp. TaxID=3048833 RepID=UPI003F00BFDC